MKKEKLGILILIILAIMVSGCSKHYTKYEASMLEWSGDTGDLEYCSYSFVTLEDNPRGGYDFIDGWISVKDELSWRASCDEIMSLCDSKFYCTFHASSQYGCSGRDCDHDRYEVEFAGKCVCTLEEYEKYGNSSCYVKAK